ncbi:hypothetical protein PPRY_a4108 [Pseudoalteromonas prydzensis ACAM 620]|nr:hypothetical protein [Pseudoalteromonas prydzensis ACAM 620]
MSLDFLESLKLSIDKKIGKRNMRSPSEIKFNFNRNVL